MNESTPRVHTARTLAVDRVSTDLGRRQFLGGAALLGAAGLWGTPAFPRGEALGVKVERGTLVSKHWPGRVAGWGIARPRRPRGLVLALHGMGGSARVWFDLLQAADVAAQTGLAIAAIDGARTYWHSRRDHDTGAMIMQDFLPMLAARGLPTQRVGLTGVSMGGYGALHLVGRLPGQVFGVATVSAALRWEFADTSPGAFDDAADFRRNSIFNRVGTLTGLPVLLTCGTEDRFIDGNRALAAVLPQAHTRFDRGGHTNDFCTSHWSAAMGWLAERV